MTSVSCLNCSLCRRHLYICPFPSFGALDLLNDGMYQAVSVLLQCSFFGWVVFPCTDSSPSLITSVCLLWPDSCRVWQNRASIASTALLSRLPVLKDRTEDLLIFFFFYLQHLHNAWNVLGIQKWSWINEQTVKLCIFGTPPKNWQITMLPQWKKLTRE